MRCLAEPTPVTARTGGLLHAHTFRHEMFAYKDGMAGFVRGLIPLISTALADERPVLVAVPGERVALLQDALGPGSERVQFIDMPDALRGQYQSFTEARMNRLRAAASARASPVVTNASTASAARRPPVIA